LKTSSGMKWGAVISTMAALVVGCATEPTSQEQALETNKVQPAPAPATSEMTVQSEALGEEQQRGVWAEVIEVQRIEWINNLEATDDVLSVDRLEFEDGTLVLGITSGWASSDSRQDAAWSVARDIRDLWSDLSWPNEIERDPVWHMDLVLTVDDLLYRCNGETMRSLAERRLERTEWETACA